MEMTLIMVSAELAHSYRLQMLCPENQHVVKLKYKVEQSRFQCMSYCESHTIVHREQVSVRVGGYSEICPSPVVFSHRPP